MKNLSNLKKIKKQDKQAIIEIAKILKNKFPITEIILFGSKARGDDNKYSDIDLLILVKNGNLKNLEDEIFNIVFDYELKKNLIINTYIFEKKIWQSPKYKILPIYENIQDEGVSVWSLKKKI